MREQTVDYKTNYIQKEFDKILHYAISQEAEEIRFDLDQNSPAVFYRSLDDWKKIADLSLDKIEAMKSYLQYLSGIVKDKDNSLQTGNFKINFDGFKIVFKVVVNSLPQGDKIFIELYKENINLLGLRQLGLSNRDFKIVYKNLCSGQGMTIVTGDFHSGATSTLYSFVEFFNKPELNVCTIESEIDYDIPFINQIKINTGDGLDYHYALSSLINQDPDVIMVGDISDRKTAEGAFRAADKGHIVLAGIYSRDILTTMSFLRDMDIALPLFLQVVNLMINQRLAQKICPHCITKSKLNYSQLESLQKIINLDSILKRIDNDRLLPANIKKIEDITFYKGRGCHRCEETGLWGSIGVFEILEITKEVRQLIASGYLSKIKNEISNQGGLHIIEDAFIKAVHGVISIEEVLKINNDLQY